MLLSIETPLFGPMRVAVHAYSHAHRNYSRGSPTETLAIKKPVLMPLALAPDTPIFMPKKTDVLVATVLAVREPSLQTYNTGYIDCS